MNLFGLESFPKVNTRLYLQGNKYVNAGPVALKQCERVAKHLWEK